jgi:REP element-mobilizing transposase RayT
MVIAYMLTWTTYGTWLQGDRRRWVKDGEVHQANAHLENINRQNMKAKSVTLSKEQRTCAVNTIINESAKLKQEIFTLAVSKSHIHLLLQNINLPIGKIVSHYKHAIRLKLQKQGFKGNLWTRGFDKRYCMDNNEISARIKYINTHENNDAEILVSPQIYSAGLEINENEKK